MKKVFLICLFAKETNKYVSTYNQVFATKELATIAANDITNPYLIPKIIKVDMILEKDYVK